jgi:L-alanine-DL-glutamate epimerase-like enolase superfamily enzyme
MARIIGMDVLDIRFPTSRELDGSDAMNPDPDYSAAYVVLRTDEGPDGYGLAFTIGRGNDVQAAGNWSATRSCAGSARRRASRTWRSAPSSTRRGTSRHAGPTVHCGGSCPR